MNLNPPAKGSVLKKWDGSLLLRIFALATISLDSPKKITQEWKRGSERAVLLLAGLFYFEMSKREVKEGVWGVFIPRLTETSHWEKDTRILRVYVPDTPDIGVRRLRSQRNFR
jgi:hypothetical protein